MEEQIGRIRITDEINDYFINKLEKCETMEQLQMIEDFFYEFVEFDKESWKVLAEIAKVKMMLMLQ